MDVMSFYRRDSLDIKMYYLSRHSPCIKLNIELNIFFKKIKAS